MIDNGFSRREVLRRMHELGLDEHAVRALLLTHEHTDHVSGISVWCRAFDVELYASIGTPETRSYLNELDFCEFVPGARFHAAGISVQTFATSHDVENPVGFRFECSGDSIGYATDTGCLDDSALAALTDARIIALESNHDVPMLRTGSYPRYLQDRIISNVGHLSNDQAAGVAERVVGPHTEQLVAMHISQENNRPSLAVRSFAAALGAELDNELGSSATLIRDGGAPSLHIRAAGQNRPLTIS